MSRLSVTLILSINFLSISVTYAEPSPAKVVKAKWYYVETDNFTIVADTSKKTAARLAQNLENFRSFVALFNGGELPTEARPVKVYITDNDRNYKLLASYNERLENTGGYFRDTLNGNYAVMRYRDSNSINTLFHEYTHYLTANLVTKNLPFWYNEGLAEFLGEIEFKRNNLIHYGKISNDHFQTINYFGWYNVEKLFRTRFFDYKKRNQTALIYSMSWLAVHYFRSDPELSKQLKEYLHLTQNGVDEAVAVQQSMGIDFKELNSKLRAYSRKGRYGFSKITTKDSLTDAQLQVLELDSADAAYHLGEHFLQASSDSERAEKYFVESLKHNPQHVKSLAGRANVAMLECEEDHCKEAKSIIDEAKKIGPNDPFVATVSGHIHEKMMTLDPSPEVRKQLRKIAVRDYNRAINSGSVNLEAISAAASMYVSEGRWEKAYELYEIVYHFAPSNYSARVSMIQAHFAKGEIKAAEQIAGRIRNNNHFSEKGLARFEAWYEKLKKKNAVKGT